MGYDLIGDIHGCADSLEALLVELGYGKCDGVYRHPSRRVVFLGDFVDRGPHQRRVLETVRPMIDSGTALSVMGNHEFNAIAYSTPDGNGGYLRPHTERNARQHKAFLDAYEPDTDDYDDVIAWFKTLPLWLDLSAFRVVHACWDKAWVDRITTVYGGSRLTDELLARASGKGSWQYEAVEDLLKGKEVALPGGRSFRDKDGNERHAIRVRWWDPGATTYREAFMGPESAQTHIPDDDIAGDHLVDYTHDDPPVFLGHYWLEGEPEPLGPNIVCLDYSVAKPGGRLVAYRWNPGEALDKGHYLSIGRREEAGQ